ncbi:hypothetical protein SCHPADRAFT_761936 [Schizopora paradoxa]|uniref:Uncharacterized protein n=1 Tax=Schizopora paradoxa TaxID=27342 RepID=A0A0H2QX09_9AGAM|nr:hypothetical protein SCHPADRAFT_761936 [Schizopora paradoxa]
MRVGRRFEDDVGDRRLAGSPAFDLYHQGIRRLVRAGHSMDAWRAYEQKQRATASNAPLWSFRNIPSAYLSTARSTPGDASSMGRTALRACLERSIHTVNAWLRSLGGIARQALVH